MTNVEAVFFDVDGTLMSLETGRIPDSTKELLAILKWRGIKRIICTGRSYAQIAFLKEYDFDGYITFNGSYCVTKEGKSLFKKNICTSELLKLHEYIQGRDDIPVAFTGLEGTFITESPKQTRHLFQLLDIPFPAVKPFTYALENEIIQLSIYVDHLHEQYLTENILQNLDATRWHPEFLDFNTKGTNKSTGMQQFEAHLGIHPSATIAFGDGGNDIPMLQYAGLGIAMGQARADVKRAADYVTEKPEENGIWTALKKLSII